MKKILVLKFGGGCINSSDKLQKAAEIIKTYLKEGRKLIVVFSAFDKTTDRLARAVDHYRKRETSEADKILAEVGYFHCRFVSELFRNEAMCQSPEFASLCSASSALSEIKSVIELDAFEAEDRIISFGELVAVQIVLQYLEEIGIPSTHLPAREIIKTNTKFTQASLDLVNTLELLEGKEDFIEANNLLVTEGFIASGPDGRTTTLGREGSDYTAAIIAGCLKLCGFDTEIILYKNVAGVYDKDPMIHPEAVRMSRVSYKDLQEIISQGAKVIHPQVIDFLKDGKIPFRVQSFDDPFNDSQGSVIF